MDLDCVNARFSSPTGGYNFTSTPWSSESGVPQNVLEDGHISPIMELKPGSDNALPSPNGIIAANLLLLSSYLGEPSYQKLAKQTIDAFAIEILQHPFLFVSMLSAIILEALGVKSVVAIGDTVVHHLVGFGKTVIRLHGRQEEKWLMERNHLLRCLELREGEKGRMMICRAGICRELEEGDLDARGDQT